MGSTEAVRRALSFDEVRAVVQSHVNDLCAEADRYHGYEEPERAQSLRREADALQTYLEGPVTDSDARPGPGTGAAAPQ